MDKVLIADEDAQLLMILADSLDKYRSDFEVITVTNGLEAILALQKETYAAVITEIRMPKVNGLVLMGYLAKNYQDTACVVMTDVCSEALKHRLAGESIQYIEKPFKIQQLAEIILSVLDRKETFGGKLKGVSVAGFLNLVESERLSCVCEVSSPKMGKGYLIFRNGVLYNAKQGDITGEAAARKLLGLKEPVIKYASLPNQNIPRLIRRKLSELVPAH
ncbi:MAG: response regulator [Desulfobacteraceae bacterium]|nr:response regulator [Desulfobacteraceae bacterium]